jgi:hypothetical protein
LLRDFETSPPDELEQRELVRIRRPPWSIPH